MQVGANRPFDVQLVALLLQAHEYLLGQILGVLLGTREALDGGADMRIVGLKQFFEHRLVISL